MTLKFHFNCYSAILDNLLTDGKGALQAYVLEKISGMNTQNRINTIPRDFFVLILNFCLIRSVAMLTLQNLDTSMRTNQTNSDIGGMRLSTCTDMQFCALKSMPHSVVMVRAKDGVYRLPQTLVLFQLKVPGAFAWNEDHAFVQYLKLIHLLTKFTTN